ncbi:FTR1 family protein [Salinimonas lutimaris]|uniref:FTR1 family iron permease n=1 Tax=Salinimonas lutimaris TaxID=914153 RepID=UPI0010BFC605|nr:FTR1 family iron permease [Salinimonas lutimaris]
MLINTVILFIRDTLPVFLLVSLLLSFVSVPRYAVLSGVGSGGLLALLVYLGLDGLLAIGDGNGLEWLKIGALLLGWLALVVSLLAMEQQCSNQFKALALGLMAALFTLPNAIHFLIYSLAYWPGAQSGSAMMLGTVIGLGISLSLAILLNMLLSGLTPAFVRALLLCAFCAGQVAAIANMLEQINWLPDQTRIWNTAGWLKDESEYGHLFNALFGYEETPSQAYLITYCVAFLIPLVAAIAFRKHSVFLYVKAGEQ